MFKNIFRFISASLLTLALTSTVHAGENVLKNGSFTEVNGNGQPSGWRLFSPTQKFSIDKSDKPAKTEASVCVEVVKASDSHGFLSKKIKVTPNSKYKMSGFLKCTAPRGAYYQVKLTKERKEIKRIQIAMGSSDWKEVSKEFSTEDADTIIILCRFRQGEEQMGAKAWFADAKVEKL